MRRCLPIDSCTPGSGHSAKVSSLSDLEYRVWTTYLLGADDFGVMRAEAVAFQAAHDALSRRPAKAIGGCIERLVKAGLVAAFVHQGARYLYQVDWQDFQRVRYPLRDAPSAAGCGGGEPEDAASVVGASGRREGAGAAECGWRGPAVHSEAISGDSNPAARRHPSRSTGGGFPEYFGKIPGKFPKTSGNFPVSRARLRNG